MQNFYKISLFLMALTLSYQSLAEDCGTHARQKNRSIVMINEKGEPDIWDIKNAQNLSFCISEIFRSNYEKVEMAMRAASLEWMKYGNFDFQLADDLSCNNINREVLFEVVPTARQAKFKARAFFPSSPPQKRKIQINRRFAGLETREFERLMLHELGHVLGLRHEHIHPNAGGDCPEIEEFETVTDYDPFSIMHYPTCGPQTLNNFVLSSLDKVGISILYPF